MRVRVLKAASLAAASIVVLAGFIFFKPPVNYFVTVSVSTVVVWPTVLAIFGSNRFGAILTGGLIQVIVQQLAFRIWFDREAENYGPLLQFLCLQYVIVVRLAYSSDRSNSMKRSS